MKRIPVKKSAAELLKEVAETYKTHGFPTTAPEKPKTLKAEDLESLVTSSVEDEPVEKKPPFESGKYVTLGGYFRVDQGVYAVLKRNIQRSVNTLLLGPTGVGKTELVSNIANDLKLPITIFDMGTMTDPIMSLVGNHVIKMHDGVTTSTFVKSRFSEVIQQPGIVMLDEISRAVVTSNNLLFPCLDFRRELPMEYCFEDTAPIKVHPKCVFIATANLGGQYTGTHKLDRALLDRFMLIEIDPLGRTEVRKAIKKHCPSLDSATLQEMIRVYADINKAHTEFTIGFSLSIRHLKMIAEMVEDGFTLYDSFYITCKGIGGPDGAKALKTIFDSKSDKTTSDDEISEESED